MRVFGCARKIYFPEIIWSWPGKWAFDHGNGLKLKFSLQTISESDAQRERERERERESARERKPYHAVDVAGEAQIVIFGSDDRTLQSEDREEAQIVRFSPTIEGKPKSHAPVWRSISRRSISLLNLASARSRLWPTDLSLWFWFLLLLCGGVVVVFGWLWLLIAGICCRGLNWSFSGVWCWLWFWNFFNKICLDAEKIVKKMWKICRKIAFSE